MITIGEFKNDFYRYYIMVGSVNNLSEMQDWVDARPKINGRDSWTYLGNTLFCHDNPEEITEFMLKFG